MSFKGGAHGSSKEDGAPTAINQASHHSHIAHNHLSASGASSLSSSRSSLQDTATSVPTPHASSTMGTPKSVKQLASYDKQTDPKLPLSASVSTSHSYRDSGAADYTTESSSLVSGSVAASGGQYPESVSTLQRELHFAAEIGQYLLEQNQELERALAECRNEGEWLKSILAQVDKAALSVATSRSDHGASTSSSGSPFKLPRNARGLSAEDQESLNSQSESHDQDELLQSTSSSEPRRTITSASDMDAPDAVERFMALREEHAQLKKEAHLRLRRLQRSQSEVDALKHEIEALSVEISDLKEENRLAALEHNRLRAAHAEDLERVKKLIAEPRKKYAELESILSTSQSENFLLSDRLKESTQEVAELRQMLSDARETIEGYKVELELRSDRPFGERAPPATKPPLSTSTSTSSIAVQTLGDDFKKVKFSLPTSTEAAEDGVIEEITTSGATATELALVETPKAGPVATTTSQEVILLNTDENQVETPRNIVQTSDISTIVRLMVGSWLLKYNKRRSKAEKRFVMVNPYTRTISWSKRDPSDEKNDGVSTVYIQSVQVEDLTDGRSRIVIIAPTREVVFECRSAAEHAIWERGLTLILQNHRGAVQRSF
ncbi:hypothetical protein HDU97_003499 [Phlyctochytrium planicorne]|nr:hypothetical protein HDU97_003499 [Phlyctochytrium planicorne]